MVREIERAEIESCAVEAGADGVAEGKFADGSGKIGNRSGKNCGGRKRALADVKTREPCSKGESPDRNGGAALCFCPLAESVEIRDGLAGGEKHAGEIVGNKIAHDVACERAAMEVKGKFDKSGVKSQPV